VKIFMECHVADVVDLVLDEPLAAGPVLQVGGLGVLGRQRDGVVGGFPAGLASDGAGAGDPHGLLGVGEPQATGRGHGDGLDGAGLPPSVAGVAAAVTRVRHRGQRVLESGLFTLGYRMRRRVDGGEDCGQYRDRAC
jgi:hypothetical protein